MEHPSPTLLQNRLWYRFSVTEWANELEDLSNGFLFSGDIDNMDDPAAILNIHVLQLRALLIELGQCFSRDKAHDILVDIVASSENILTKINTDSDDVLLIDSKQLLNDLTDQANVFINKQPTVFWQFISYLANRIAKWMDYGFFHQSEHPQNNTNSATNQNTTMLSSSARIAKMPAATRATTETAEIDNTAGYSFKWQSAEREPEMEDKENSLTRERSFSM